MDNHAVEGSLVFDSLDVDMFVKVLAHTVFGPFFVFFIPVFYIFQGARVSDSIVVYTSVYWVAISLFWFIKWTSRLYRNQGSLFFGPGMLDWGEQIVLITGGSSGVGELLANTLAVRNVNVVVLDVNPITTENYNITYYKCDVSKWEEVEAVSKKVIEEIGNPTVLVNNAGVVQGKSILDLDSKDIEQTFEVNTFAHYWVLKAFLPAMLKNKNGHIVTMSSVLGYHGVAQLSDYCASKAAVTSLHESLRYELDVRYNCPRIRTTLVTAGHIFTPLFATVALPNSWWFKFFFPTLQPITVVKRILAALDEQHSQHIMVPFYANFVPYLSHMPSFVQAFAQSVTRANYAMQRFTKVSGFRSDEGDSKHN